MGLLYFLLLIGPLIFFHELGHFMVARWFGVRVDEFAIGFGPPIAGIRRGDTLYTLRALPLGGFVMLHGAMDDPHDVDAFDDEEPSAGDSFAEKPIWQRILVLLAGPIMNLVLPIPILFALFAAVDSRTPAVVGMVMTDSPAALAGLEPGDEVVAIDGRRVRWFDDLSQQISRKADVPIELQVVRGDETLDIVITPSPVVRREGPMGLRTRVRGQIGILGAHPRPVLDVVDGSQGALAGLQTFDTVLSIGDVPVRTWPEAARLLAAAEPGTPVELLRLRANTSLPGALFTWAPYTLALSGPVTVGEDSVRSALRTIAAVSPCTPAAEAGVQAGDRILAVDGHAVDTVVDAWTRIYHEPDRPHRLTLERGQEEVEVTLSPLRLEVIAELRFPREETFVGFHGLPMSTQLPPRPMQAIERLRFAFSETFLTLFGLMTALIGAVVGMFIGVVDTNQLGGPIAIFQVASDAGSQGWGRFFEMMAFISVNLAIINLVPVPGLDGGQISLLSIEGITRRPLSPRTRQIVHFIGFACIFLLMILVFKNDLQRYWGDIRLWLNG